MKNRAIIHDINEFLKTEPLFCLICKKFTYTASEYCENCGSKYSLRKPKVKDVKQYNKAIKTGIQYQLKEQFSPLKPISYVSGLDTDEFPTLKFNSDIELKNFLVIQRYFCMYCKKFTIRNRGYCENCGTKSSLRRSNKNDIDRYNKMQELTKQERENQKQLKERKPPTATSEWKEKFEDITSPKPQISEITQPISISEPSQTEVEALLPIPSIKKEEKTKEVSKLPAQKTSSFPESFEKPIPKVSKELTEKLKPIPSPLIKTEEKTKEVSHFCKFCGMKLAQMVKFCNQCGTVIKHQQRH